MIATILFGYLCKTWLLVIQAKVSDSHLKGLRVASGFIIGLLLIQILFGGLMAGMRAGLLHPHFPAFVHCPDRPDDVSQSRYCEMSSGLSGQCFTFHGYLPVDKPKLVTKLKEMEKDSFKNNCAQIFMETPYRNQQLMQVINSSLHDETFLTVACDINSTSEFIKTKKVSYWKQHNENLHKRPCIYIIQKK